LESTIWKNEKSTFDKIAKEVREKGKQREFHMEYMSEAGNLSSNQRLQQRANSYEFINANGEPILLMENNGVAEFNYTYNKNGDQVSIVYDKINRQFAYYLHSGHMGHNLLALVSPVESDFPVYSSQEDPYAGLLKLHQKGQISDEEKKSTIRETIEKDLLAHPMFKNEAYEILAGFDQILSIDIDREIQPLTHIEIENAKLRTEIKNMKEAAIIQGNEAAELRKKLAELQQENTALKDENAVIKGENTTLIEENENKKNQITKLQHMLASALEFATKVRESVVGKLFFKKPLQELDMNGQLLPEGDER